MIQIEGRFEVKLISNIALAQYMDFREISVRGLATETGGHRATIGHLRSGKRNSCKPELAKAIEKALQAPPGSLFVPSVSRVSREVAPRVRVGRATSKARSRQAVG